MAKRGRPRKIRRGRPKGRISSFRRPKKTVYGSIRIGKRKKRSQLSRLVKHPTRKIKRGKRLTRKSKLIQSYLARKANPVKRVRRRRIRRHVRSMNPPVRRRRRRRAVNPTPIRRRRRRRLNSWPGQPRRHRKVARRIWAKRKAGGRKVRGRWRPYRTRKGYPYRVPRKRGKRYPKWSSKTRNWRTWNAGAGLKDVLIPALLGVAGIVAASAIVSKMPDSVKSKLVLSGKNLAPVVIPAAVGAGLLLLAPKIKPLAKYSSYVNPIALGMLMLAGLRGVQLAVAGTQMESVFQLSGYVTRPGMSSYRKLAGYRSVPMSSYRAVNSLGESVRALPAPSALDPDPMVPGGSKIPYGTGLSLRKRAYNKFDWQGVYDKAVYE